MIYAMNWQKLTCPVWGRDNPNHILIANKRDMELITVGERKDSLSKLAYTIDPNMGDYLQAPFLVQKYESALRSLRRGTLDMWPAGYVRGSM